MGLLSAEIGAKPVHLTLTRDRVRALKAGSPWLYADSLRELPPARPGSMALIKTKDGDIIAKGFYDPGSQLAFRAVAVRERRLDDALVAARLERAVAMRQRLFEGADTDGYRLVNGEGDGLPGLVCDVYASTAVVKLDGAGPAGFYNAKGIAQWLVQRLPRLNCVWLKHRAGEDSRGALLLGERPARPVVFVENGVRFESDVVMGQKTGFFLDQRDNRKRMQPFARGRRVLNLFAYTGGFSAYAGAAGAAHVTSVDLAAPACASAEVNWGLNGLDAGRHAAVAADCFAFLEDAAAAKEAWDVVIVDPPSFAPSKQSVTKATASYERLFAAAVKITASGGILALSSCSSHIDFPLFHQARPGTICDSAVGRARRSAAVLGVYGQPEDHPFPAACQELRYLKFVTHALD
ncbi:putative SAM-dependentmethyltransferase [Monoraphidium neglectum]|uniref:Putative SAM-dependentmethyltransferase n=1 Tax=Monoraphidium neglectum TaxID=145388 RepID=A0A0D2MC23_9CHLO|nr:putative SAM-dependentmethyltransferase [Monoraphidium neglectum]KIZ00780.1 putative SAM-dependentmethyltransferase [Monoraphidium neglectum]|eukprot:XP_013899799.1 putative SAM-dependentmethyltransferase [Monoraphidium neglectum]